MSDTYTSRTLREITRIVASRFHGVVLIFLAVVIFIAAATIVSPRWYRSHVTLLARPGVAGNPLEASEAGVLRDNVSLFVMTQREIVASDFVLASALMKLDGLPVAPEAPGQAASWYGSPRVGAFIRENAKRLRQLKEQVSVVTPGGPDATFTQNFTIRVDCSTSAKTMPNSRRDTSRQAAAMRAHDLAEAVKEAYLMRFSELESRRSRQALDLLENQALASARLRLEGAATAFRDFIDNELKGDLLQVINMVGGRAVGAETGDASLATRFRGEINKLDEQIAQVGALRAAIDKELAKSDDADLVIPDAVTAGNPSIQTLQAKIIDAKIVLNSLVPRYTDAHQEVSHTRGELALVQADLRGELTKQSDRLAQELAVLQARRAVLAGRVEEDRRRVDELAGKVARYDQLQRSVESAQAIFNEEQRRVVSAVTAEKLAQNPVLVSTLDDATYPDPREPRRPIIWLNLLIAALGGLVLALAYAFLADHFDHSIKSVDEAERYLGVPVLASVPRIRGRIISHT
jgi:uncharacterized protein involved in exopolysaccharide biosynthesis